MSNFLLAACLLSVTLNLLGCSLLVQMSLDKLLNKCSHLPDFHWFSYPHYQCCLSVVLFINYGYFCQLMGIGNMFPALFLKLSNIVVVKDLF